MIRKRLTYAAQSFAAVYGFGWRPSDAQVRLCYGIAPSLPRDVALTVAYKPLAERTQGVHPYVRDGLFLDGESDAFPRFHRAGDGADWLGEIFEWLGNETEHHVTATDAIGRVPFARSISGRFGLDAEVPWAAIAMRGLNEDIRRSVAGWPDRPQAKPYFVATHDLDFLPVSRAESAKRGVKNVLIALLLYRDPALALRLLPAIGAVDSFADAARRERAAAIESSSYVIVEKKHRRDANYILEDPRVLSLLRELHEEGMEVGVHGSYTSVAEGGSLANEYARLRAAGHAVHGGRQHWLRFRGLELFDALEAAGASYDSSMGWSDRPGYRSGACFPYVPYDLRHEKPFALLEFPLVIMDATLFDVDRYDFDRMRARCERLLRRSALYANGGSSILWHNNAFTRAGAQLPRQIGALYWQLKHDDADWIAGRTAVDRERPRFRAAGLLQAVSNVT